MNRHARRSEAGFSFAELLITIIIAGIAFAAMVPLFVQAQQVTASDKMRAIALNVAQDRIEKLRQLDYELVTEGNLSDNDFYFGEFGDSWTEQTENGSRDFEVTYVVTEAPVSAADTRIAYKVVTVTVNWTGPPLPHKNVVLTTMIYRQYAGPMIVDFFVAASDLGLSDPMDPGSEPLIVSSPVDLQATVNAADLDSMRPRVLGASTRTGRVDFSVSSSTGTVYPKISVPFSEVTGAVFSTAWTVPGGTAGAGDGYYLLKAVAYSAMGSPGNSWQLIYRIETGPPAPVTNLAGTAGLSSANLTWDASVTGDVDHYVVYRDGVQIAEVDKAAGSMGYTYDYSTNPDAHGDTHDYAVYAVDWKDQQSVAAELSLVSIDPASLVPAPASDLQGQAISTKARLTWVASPTPGVLGYRVEQTIGATTSYFTTASGTLDVEQGWNTTALYQVKPFVAGSIFATSYATLLVGQPQQVVGGVAWLQVTTGAEPRYSLVITNTTNKSLTSLRLYYLGPAGSDPQVEIMPAASGVAVNTTRTWSNLAAGLYKWDWRTSNNKTGSQTGWCTGATLTIYGSTP